MTNAADDHHSDNRLHVLSGALRAFAEATTDYERLVGVIARTVASVVADGCIVRVLSEGGWLAPVAYHLPLEARIADVEARARVHAFMSARRNVNEFAWGQHLVDSGEFFLLRHLEMQSFRGTVRSDVADVYETMGIHSMLVVALRLRGETIGTLSLFRYHVSSTAFDERDVDMAQALADHAALAMANARSYVSERAARAIAEKATARFARLSESGVVGTVVIDLDDRRIVDINDALLNMIGYARDDFSSGRVSWTSLTPPGWGEVDARALEQLATSGVSGLREKEFIRKDGRRIPVLAGSAMLGDGTRECISFVLDLSERKEAERAQREAERRSERIVKSATVGMWMFDAEGRTTFMNPRMAEILGVTVTGALLKPVTDFARPDDPPTIDERLKGWKAGLPSAFEQTFWRADESAVVLWVEASPMHDAEGRFEGVISIVTDITARRDMEEQLKASEARYRLMFDQSPLAKWLYDATTLRFLDVNVAAIRDLGYDREEYLGMTLKDLRAPAEAPPLDDLHRHAGDRSEFTTLRLRRKSGEVLEFEMTSHAITVGNRLCRLAVGRDVTERCRLEEQLRQAQKMEAVGRLAGGVAHDFNNVLSVILTYAELMLSDLNDDDPMRSEVQEIKTAAERARDLTRQLLMFSRQQVVAPKVLDLNDVVTRMEKMLQRLLGADVDLVSRPSRPLRRVRADPTSVEQVILNLVVNARDAMPTGGQLTMETADVVLDEAYAERHLGVKAGPHVMLAVTDTGTGIEKAVQARIFEPFFTTKEAGKGTGLGLSTVFGIVQQCGGSVWVYSEVGRGTTFKVYFPSVDADVESGHRMEAPTRRGSETILLVEDDDQVRKVAQGILRRSGYRIIEARNAGEALLHSEQHAGTIDLLLSDVVMPQMSGPTLAMRLASARPGMKVLCMSGYTDDSIVRHGVLDAKIAFLQKPITTETLTSKVREVLDARAKEEEPEKR